MKQFSKQLPIAESLPQIRSALADNAPVILSAAPGAGKSTIVPLALKDEVWLSGQRIVILQPRRIAAVALARRMAFLDGSRPGQIVGHQVRFDSNIKASTRIEVLTEGILTRRLQKDPILEGIGLVIFDEFHERSLHTDLCLALCREIRREVRPDLRIMLMSATADLELAKSFLDHPQLIEGKGFLHPVEIFYRPTAGGRDPVGALARVVEQIVAEGPGEEYLVFLPGMGEILRVAGLLESSSAAAGYRIMLLHGSLPVNEQEKVLQPADRPRIILSTNIAETSLTIDGITRVIDSGEARWIEVDEQSGLEQLRLHRISRSSAIQRAGRAGRVKPGKAYRLWSQAEHQQLAANDQPEILRVDSTATVLELFAWGCRDPLHFSWLQSPGAEPIAKSVELLQLLGAVEATGKITDEGRQMVELPLEPRLARMLLTASKLGVAFDAALVAAMLGEKDFVKAVADGSPTRTDADLDWRLQLLTEQSTAALPGNLQIDAATVRRIFKVQRQLLDILGKRGEKSCQSAAAVHRLHEALLSAFPDRVCLRRSLERSGNFTICSGQGLTLSQNGLLPGEPLILALRLETNSRPGMADGRIFLACAMNEELLKKQTLYQKKREVFFAAERARVLARARIWYGSLLLSDCESAIRDDEITAAAEIIEQAALADIDKALALTEEGNQNFSNRVVTLRACSVGAGFPALDHNWLVEQVRMLAPGSRSFADLQKSKLEQLYLQQLSWKERDRFEKLVPERYTVPSGSSLRIQYQSEGAPILAVKIQELFGMAQTPAICAGHCRLLLHLLSPAGHPVQITADLASFWQTGYQQVIKDLKGRYPKHPWPDDPGRAVAFRGTKKQFARASSKINKG